VKKDVARWLRMADDVLVMKTKSLKQQVNDILHSKIKRIARACYLKANPNWQTSKKHNPYTLPQEVHDMTKMLGRIEIATNEELESFAHYATNGAVARMIEKGAI